MNLIRRLWTRYRLHVRRNSLSEGLRELLLDQEALDSSGLWQDADALTPLITTMTLELREVENQLENP